MYRGMTVSVCFPAYNEASNIANAIRDFYDTGVVDEIVVADNNSNDETADLARGAMAKVVTEQRQGYGFACQRAMKEAQGDIIVLVEPDGTFVGRDIFKLLAYIDDFEVVFGTRTEKGLIRSGSNMSAFLIWGNWGLAKLIQILYDGPCLTDVGCTMRAIKRDALEMISDRFSIGGSSFSPEMIIMAIKSKARIIQVPVNYMARVGTSKITGSPRRAFLVGLAMIKIILENLFT